MQNDALFAARTEVEDAYARFRDFFEFAPAAYVVTTPDTRVRYANPTACSRSLSPGMIWEWSATLVAKDGTSSTPLSCRMRIRAVAPWGATSPPALYWNITEETDEDLF